MHRTTRAFLTGSLATALDGPTVVVTHHAPHPDSLPDRHAYLAWCDASDLTILIAEQGPDLWVHGPCTRIWTTSSAARGSSATRAVMTTS